MCLLSEATSADRTLERSFLHVHKPDVLVQHSFGCTPVHALFALVRFVLDVDGGDVFVEVGLLSKGRLTELTSEAFLLLVDNAERKN